MKVTKFSGEIVDQVWDQSKLVRSLKNQELMMRLCLKFWNIM